MAKQIIVPTPSGPLKLSVTSVPSTIGDLQRALALMPQIANHAILEEHENIVNEWRRRRTQRDLRDNEKIRTVLLAQPGHMAVYTALTLWSGLGKKRAEDAIARMHSASLVVVKPPDKCLVYGKLVNVGGLVQLVGPIAPL